MQKTNILLADDHTLILDSLVLLLKDCEMCNKISLAHTKADVFDKVKKKKYHLVFLDLNMNGENMLNHIEALQKLDSNLKIIILTSYNSPSIISEAISKKVDGFLLKNSDKSQIINSIEKVMNGGTYMNIGQASSFLDKDGFIMKQNLSKREIDIIKRLALGETNSCISENLFISINTIQTHRKNIHKKLNISSVTELIAFAYQNKIV